MGSSEQRLLTVLMADLADDKERCDCGRMTTRCNHHLCEHEFHCKKCCAGRHA